MARSGGLMRWPCKIIYHVRAINLKPHTQTNSKFRNPRQETAIAFHWEFEEKETSWGNAWRWKIIDYDV